MAGTYTFELGNRNTFKIIRSSGESVHVALELASLLNSACSGATPVAKRHSYENNH